MSLVWKNGEIVGVTRDDHLDDDDGLFGFGVGVPKSKGIGQALLGADDLAGVDDRTLQIGRDKRVYGMRHGLIECWAHVEPTSDKPNVYVDRIDWTGFPPEGELAWLFHNFFSKCLDREVVMLTGHKRDGSGHLYCVPEQIGTGGGVEWDTKGKEMDWFQERAHWIGTLHSHPGNCCSPSQTDIDDWANPEKSGLHVIFGRDGSYTVNGAIANRTFTLLQGDLSGVVCVPTTYLTSGGRSLKELLKKPKPVVIQKLVSRSFISGGRSLIGEPTTPKSWTYPHERDVSSQPLWWDDEKDYVEESLDAAGALLLGEEDGTPSVHVVRYNRRSYVMRTDQYADLTEWCHNVCPVPTSRVVKLYGMRGGK
jgi:hypothetical protein